MEVEIQRVGRASLAAFRDRQLQRIIWSMENTQAGNGGRSVNVLRVPSQSDS